MLVIINWSWKAEEKRTQFGGDEREVWSGKSLGGDMIKTHNAKQKLTEHWLTLFHQS